MACDGLLFLILGYFCPFILLPPPPNGQKNQNSKFKKKKQNKNEHLQISSFYTSAQKS